MPISVESATESVAGELARNAVEGSGHAITGSLGLAQERGETPSIIGDSDSHGTLRRVLSERAPCSILDAPCGEGILAQFLLERGWQVQCADIDSRQLRIQGVP